MTSTSGSPTGAPGDRLFPIDSVREIQAAVISWGRAHRREFPWRRSLPIWKALVVEVMLLRTRADQVVAVFEAFDRRYHSPKDFAAASDEELQDLFAPLGLRWRVPLLIQLARQLGRTGGRLPLRQDGLEELPGVGPYAAAATLSLHTNRPATLIDANTVRVIARLLGRPFDGETRRKAWLRKAAGEITPLDVINRDFNYALLDLAAEVCQARRARCNRCPLPAWCATGALRDSSGGSGRDNLGN